MTPRPEPSLNCVWCNRPVAAYPPLEPGWHVHVTCFKEWEAASAKRRQERIQAMNAQRPTANVQLQSGNITSVSDAESVNQMRIPQTRNEVLPVGEYIAKITSVVADESQYGPQLKFQYALVGGDHEGVTLLGWTSQSFNPKSKLFAVVKAVFGGREIPATYELDTDSLIGKQVALVVVSKVKDDGSEFNRIDSVKPVRVAATKPKPAPIAPKAAAEEYVGPPLDDDSEPPF